MIKNLSWQINIVCILVIICFLSGCIQNSDEFPKVKDNHFLSDEFKDDTLSIINNNIPYFTDEEKQCTDAFEVYSDLDYLGRCGVAFANICINTIPTEPRGDIGNIRPSGWHTVKYSEVINDNFLYNRCHLIGYQLSGENANEKNLITGTRYLNTCGMLPFENRVRNYVKETKNHVLYRATPVFEGENLVANGVILEAWSVEDNGQGICFNVYCYNVQPSIKIDYATGESWIDEFESEETESEELNISAVQENYILNINTNKFHIKECKYVKDIADHNKMNYVGTTEKLIGLGYSPCKVCIRNEPAH